MPDEQPRYGVVRGSGPDLVFIPLSEVEFNRLTEAKRKLGAAIAAEESFDIVIEDFIDFEKACHSAAINEMVRWSVSPINLHAHRRQIARYLSHLLSSCRAYLDHLNTVNQALSPNEELATEKLTHARHKEYDGRLGYRVMEALRNFAQHRGLPVDSISFSSRRSDDNRSEHRIRLFIGKSRLRTRDPKAKVERVLDDVKGSSERIELLPMARDYVSGLAAIHTQFRSWHAETIRESERLIEDAMTQMWKACGAEATVPICKVIEQSADGTVASTTDLFPEFLQYRRDLVSRNHHFKNLEHRYVTGRELACNDTGVA